MKRIDPYLALLVLFSCFAIGPLLQPGYFWGAHDGRHSVYFLFEFNRAIQDGIFYPRWMPDFTFGYGYPFFNIYGPGAFYLSEAFYLLLSDYVVATKIVFAFAILLSGPAMFGFIKRLTGSSPAAFLSGLAYVYIPYHIADIYVRAALAESFALIFLPLTLWGFYETVVNANRTTIVAAAMAYGAMLFTHNGITLLFTPILAIWVLFLMLGELRKRPSPNYQSLITNLFRLGLPSLAALVLGIGLAAIFALPAVLEYQYVRVDQWTANYYDYSNHFVSLFQLFDPKWGFGISVPGPNDGMSFQLGVVPVLLAILSIIAVVRNPNGFRRFWLFFAALSVVIVLLMLSFSLPIWEALRLVTFAQFPWRLLTLTTVSLAVLAGAVVLGDSTDKSPGLSLPAISLGILILLGSYPYLTAQTQLQAKEGPVSIIGLMKFEQSAGEMTGSTSTVKVIPTWSDIADTYFNNKKLKTHIVSTDYPQDVLWIGVLPNFSGLHTNGERVAFTANADDIVITFNLFYYPGWRAYLVKPWSEEVIRELPIQIADDDPLGRIRVPVPQGKDQWLMLRFEDTPVRIAGEWISAFSILIALGLLVWQVRAQRKSNGVAKE